MDYMIINNTWINGSTWKPASWTVYRVSEDNQWRWRLAPPAQQESTEIKLADVHSHRTTAPCKGSQITTDSTQDGHRGKTSTLPKKENQGAAAQDFRLVGQVQWRRGHRQSMHYWRSAASVVSEAEPVPSLSRTVSNRLFHHERIITFVTRLHIR